MLDIANIKIGDKVCYQPEHYKKDNKWENGIIKFVAQDSLDTVFVVYNCAGEWKNFMYYTAAATNIRDLTIGWKH